MVGVGTVDLGSVALFVPHITSFPPHLHLILLLALRTFPCLADGPPRMHWTLDPRFSRSRIPTSPAAADTIRHITIPVDRSPYTHLTRTACLSQTCVVRAHRFVYRVDHGLIIDALCLLESYI